LHFPFSRPCSEHFPPTLSIGLHYNPLYTYPSSYPANLCSLSIDCALHPWRWRHHDHSEMLVSNHQPTQCKNPENLTF
jgi:hypothetical protein